MSRRSTYLKDEGRLLKRTSVRLSKSATQQWWKKTNRTRRWKTNECDRGGEAEKQLKDIGAGAGALPPKAAMATKSRKELPSRHLEPSQDHEEPERLRDGIGEGA
jgi:hypothetical protein